MKMEHSRPYHPLVVVLVNYHSAQDTLDCIQSIRTQDPESKAFIVVIDNSQPNDPALAVLKEFPDVELLHSTENVGFGLANNRGIDWAQDHLDFDFLLLLNNDTLLTSGALSTLMLSLQQKPGFGMATGKIMYYDRPDLVWYGGGDIVYHKGWPEIADLNAPARPEGADKAREVSFASGCMMLFNRTALERLKGFDPDFFMYCEDLELCLRAAKKDIKIYYDPRSIIYHKVHGSSAIKGDTPKNLHVRNPNVLFLFYHLKKNQFLAMRKHTRGGVYVRFLLYFWARYAYFVMKMLLRGRWGIVPVSLRTKWHILQLMLRRRTQITD